MTRAEFTANVKAGQMAFRRFLVALCCGDSARADDIAQEAYIKAYLSVDSLHDPSKFNAWLFRIGYTTFLNHRRSDSRPSAPSSCLTDDVTGEAAARIPSAEAADDSFRYQTLYMALDRLPDKERMSVLLFYMQGYSIKEISEIVAVSADAVKQHLSRGRAHLRNLLSTSNR